MVTFHGKEVPFTTPLIDLLDHSGALRLMPSQDYEAYSNDSIRLWCTLHGRYGLPTVETVAWLREQVGGRSAIEVGAGAGDLCRHLGIHGTDNHCQEWPAVRRYYAKLGTPPISYAPWVETLDAVEALRRYQPQVVVGSWLTEWVDPTNMNVGEAGGSIYGIKEDAILDSGATYIMVGNEKIHGAKSIMRHPHETHALPFLRSKSSSPEMDRVYIWRGRK